MRALSLALRASLLRTASISHELAKGEAREAAIRRELRPHIPGRYGLSSGLVVNLAGQESKQQDVIISDEVENSPFMAEGGLTRQPIEAVVATLEVKSVATPEEMRDGVAKALSVAALLGDEPRSTYKPGIGAQLVSSTCLKPFAGLIALRSSSPRESLVKAWAEAHRSDRPWDRSNGLVVIDDFFACWTHADGQLSPVPDPTCSTVAIVDAGEDSLLWFYVLMMFGIQLYPRPTLDVNRYFVAANVDNPSTTYDPGFRWGSSSAQAEPTASQ
jgi:Domain of unknown function (DUF6602)